MWRYAQSTGQLSHDETPIAIGYSGAGEGKNNPLLQHVQNVGPLPQGQYHILPPIDTPTHGPYVLWLNPLLGTELFGRSRFGMHGDSLMHPGAASLGCIILPRAVRELVWTSGDRTLTVVA